MMTGIRCTLSPSSISNLTSFTDPDIDALELYRRPDTQSIDRTAEIKNEFLRFAE